jgi:hypothetical protein
MVQIFKFHKQISNLNFTKVVLPFLKGVEGFYWTGDFFSNDLNGKTTTS